ncbi:Dyp-type peroxidase [Gordonia sp. (in: high G+C Gram-positive bacteria)]|uniref:Dyp-type peroxidase n=1 Tax=Gordonia sp. (in: high G+C Gram-positive bacteria) TaxID=84139 RepID=UPI0016981940|nr:Dyp-type peroxidase [Gordonia sp. (in: high G+C Gram-positive bacteria)]NLG45647.1 Dyp-type peroxidase [Gordonia sp. (in: high G+C Gram-positive bacteria)]
MSTPQSIITRKTSSSVFLVLTINDGGEGTVRDALAELPDLSSAVGSRAPEAALAAIVGIGSAAWDRLYSGPRPRSLRPFTELVGGKHTAPATPGDLLIHIKADRMDLCYEVGQRLTQRLGAAVTTVDEVHGFRYFDLRDLIGFVDGTENPVGQDAVDAITVGDEDPDFAGGSYVVIQRYVTDFADWEALSVEDQEKAIGRTKLENIEMADDVKPANSHIALNVITDDDGNEIDILRDNMPYGDISGSGEKGTFYIAYSSGPDVSEQMLRNMFIGEPEGNYDRLLDFTTAVTGGQFFVPTSDFLSDPPEAPDPAELGATAADSEPAPRSDGSLGIGSLR